MKTHDKDDGHDGNRGHGNDEDGYDDDNPGKSRWSIAEEEDFEAIGEVEDLEMSWDADNESGSWTDAIEDNPNQAMELSGSSSDWMDTVDDESLFSDNPEEIEDDNIDYEEADEDIPELDYDSDDLDGDFIE